MRPRGWQRWRGETWALTPNGRVRTAQEDDSIFAPKAAVALDLSEALTCDWRESDLWVSEGPGSPPRRPGPR